MKEQKPVKKIVKKLKNKICQSKNEQEKFQNIQKYLRGQDKKGK
jgi:hypothetical protein